MCYRIVRNKANDRCKSQSPTAQPSDVADGDHYSPDSAQQQQQQAYNGGGVTIVTPIPSTEHIVRPSQDTLHDLTPHKHKLAIIGAYWTYLLSLDCAVLL